MLARRDPCRAGDWASAARTLAVISSEDQQQRVTAFQIASLRSRSGDVAGALSLGRARFRPPRSAPGPCAVWPWGSSTRNGLSSTRTIARSGFRTDHGRLFVPVIRRLGSPVQNGAQRRSELAAREATCCRAPARRCCPSVFSGRTARCQSCPVREVRCWKAQALTGR